jgi:DNA polymerase-3 subunit gamma/tau
VRAGADARTRLELALVRAAKPEVESSTRALLARIERLEGKTGVLAAGANRDADREQGPAGEASSSEPVGGRAKDAAQSSGTHASADPRAVPTASPASAGAQAPIARPAAPVIETESGVPGASQGAPGAQDLESLRSAWPAVVDLVRAANGLLGALIEEAQPVALAGEELTVAFAASAPFLKKKAEDPVNRAAVTAALRDITGGRWSVSYELRDELEAPDSPERGGRSEQEWVRRLMEEFDAEELPGDIGLPGSGEAGAEAVTSEKKGA